MKIFFVGFIDLVALIITSISGAFEKIINFCIWIVSLELSKPTVSSWGGVAVTVLTSTFSFAIVGAIFNLLRWFHFRWMKIAYLIVSTIVSCGLCYLISLLEKNRLAWLILEVILLVLVLIRLRTFDDNQIT
mgnify:FL=1